MQESSFLEDISQTQATAQCFDANGYMNVGPAMRYHQESPLANNYDVASTQVYQPSPIVHAPIPILGPQFQEHGAYEVPDSDVVVSDPNAYANAEYIPQARYTSGNGLGRHVYLEADATQSNQQPQMPVRMTFQPQPQSWDEVVSQPFSGPTFPTPSELLVELQATFQGMAVEGEQAEGGPLVQTASVDFSQEGNANYASHDGTVYGQRALDGRSQVPSPSTTIQRAVDSASAEASSYHSVRISTPRSEPATRSQQNQRIAASRSVSVLPDAAPNTTSKYVSHFPRRKDILTRDALWFQPGGHLLARKEKALPRVLGAVRHVPSQPILSARKDTRKVQTP